MLVSEDLQVSGAPALATARHARHSTAQHGKARRTTRIPGWSVDIGTGLQGGYNTAWHLHFALKLPFPLNEVVIGRTRHSASLPPRSCPALSDQLGQVLLSLSVRNNRRKSEP